ncbi:MAG: transglutaminase family protein [Bacteroidales bacterium]|nr:transglutaminase family protein [Bacteroidales bacterium]
MQDRAMNLDKTKSKELKALVRLLDDPDLAVINQIEDRILSFGEAAIDLLESTNSIGIEKEVSNRIDELIRKIRFNSVYSQLVEWKQNDQASLFEMALSISAMHYPKMDIKALRELMDKITRDVWLEMNEELTPLEKVEIFNHIFFEIYSFYGNKGNLSSPQNSLINDVLESKKGNSLSMSILYLEIARRLNMPIYGIDLPQNFVLAYVNDESVLSAKHRVLFYINPFNKGIIFTKKDIDAFLKQINEPPRNAYYEVCDNVSVVKRLLSELVESFSAVGQDDNAETFQRLSKAID